MINFKIFKINRGIDKLFVHPRLKNKKCKGTNSVGRGRASAIIFFTFCISSQETERERERWIRWKIAPAVGSYVSVLCHATIC
jgi:hypothetical protein